MSARSSVLAQALQGVLPLARRVTTSPSAEVRTVTRAGVTTITVVDGDRSPLTVTLDTRPPVPAAPSTQLAMFGEDGTPARHAREREGERSEPVAETAAEVVAEPVSAPASAEHAPGAPRAPKPRASTRPAALAAEPEADQLARKGLHTIVWQQTEGAPWEVVMAARAPEKREWDALWQSAAEGHRARDYDRGRKCVRDSGGGVQ